jgi:hypothetical protein
MKLMNTNETEEVVEEVEKVNRPDGSPFVGEVVEEKEVAEELLLTLNDVRDRFVGIVNSAKTAGIATVTSRGFAAVESFLGALAGDKEKRPKE